MKKINFCKATTIILIINVILSIVLFFVVPDNIAISMGRYIPQKCSRFLLYIFSTGIVSAFCFYGKTYFYNVPV